MTANVLRWILMFLIAVQIGWAIYVIEEASKFRPPPRHVKNEAAAYILALVYIIVETHSHLGDPVTWRIPVGFGVALFGLYAMIRMSMYYKLDARIQRHKTKANVAAKKLMAESEKIVREENLYDGEDGEDNV